MPKLKRLIFLSAGALLLFGCVVTPDMQGGASSITGSFTPEQAKELMAQKKVLPATRITTRTSRNATGGRSSARVVRQRHYLTQQDYIYPPSVFMPLLRAEGIATDVVLHREKASYVPIYLGSGTATVVGGLLAAQGTASENSSMQYAGGSLVVAGVGAYLWVAYMNIMDAHTITTQRKDWAIQWNTALAEKLGLQFDPEGIRSVVFLGNTPLD